MGVRAIVGGPVVFAMALLLFMAWPRSESVAPVVSIPVASELTTKRQPIRLETPSSGGTLAEKLEEVVAQCNKDNRNNQHPKSPRQLHNGCLLLRDVVVEGDTFHFNSDQNPEVKAKTFPPFRSRHQLKPSNLYALQASEFEGKKASAKKGATQVLYFQNPVSGAKWENAWHTIADFFTMMYHTLTPLLEAETGKVISDLEYSLNSAKVVFGKGCEPLGCRKKSLFAPFPELFDGRVRFVGEDAGSGTARHYPFVLLGLNSRCSPIPAEDHVGAPECQANLRRVRDGIFTMFNIEPIQVTKKLLECPLVHVMSRQRETYRRMTPFEQTLSELRTLMERRGCPEDNIRVVYLHGGVSFRDQVQSLANHSVLLAGRGGGTALIPFLPEGAGYLSVSGFDRWSPYRDLVPDWIRLQHCTVELCHHADADKPPLQFKGGGGKMYVDPNRAGYRVVPAKVVACLDGLFSAMLPTTAPPSLP